MLLKKLKSKLSVSWLLKIVVTIAAYFYIYYRIKDAVLEKSFLTFSSFNSKQIGFVFLALIMVFPNWFLESVKWKKLIERIHRLSLTLAIKSIFIGITCAIFTPYRIGEYFGRPTILPKEKKAKSILANIIGSISQSIVTYSLGIIGTILFVRSSKSEQFFSSNQTVILLFLLLILFLLLFFYFNSSPLLYILKKTTFFNKYWEKYKFITQFSKKDLLIILLLSASRYLIFFSQYYLLLLTFDVKTSLVEAFTAISLSYIFLFSIPGIPIADIGIRGSLALFFLGFYSLNQIGIVAASSTLWAINLAIPALLGSVFLMQYKKRRINSS